MTAATLPLQLLLLTVSGWVHRHQQDVIAYLVEENRVLKEQLGGRKLRLTDDQRRRLAAKARLLGRRALDAVATLVTPDTLMRWHRRLIAWKWTSVARRVGRPGLRHAISDLIVRMADTPDQRDALELVVGGERRERPNRGPGAGRVMLGRPRIFIEEGADLLGHGQPGPSLGAVDGDDLERVLTPLYVKTLVQAAKSAAWRAR